MRFARKITFIALTLLLALGLRASNPAPEAIVLLIGDQHSAYERTAQLVAMIDGIKAQNPGVPLVILLDGDTLEYGNVVARRSGGAVDFAMFAALAHRAPTVLNLGNHEPEFYDLADTVQRVQALGVTVISNILNHATGQPFAPASTVLKLGRTDAVVVGLTTDHLATYRKAVQPSLDLANPVVWAKQNLPGLLAAAPVNIIMSHAGLVADRELFPLVPDGTLFAGAHDHLRFVYPLGRGVYVHSGSWNEYLTVARLQRESAGAPRWAVEQLRIPTDGPADPGLVTLIEAAQTQYLTGEDLAIVGHTTAALSPGDAARLMAGALRDAAGADAAFIGNTTFGAGLPAGAVRLTDFNACVRFDGTIFRAEVDGARLQQLLAAANQTPETPFDLRRGEFCFASGPATIDPARLYRIATTDWGARNTQAYFGPPAISWHEHPDLHLKAAVLPALNAR